MTPPQNKKNKFLITCEVDKLNFLKRLILIKDKKMTRFGGIALKGTLANTPPKLKKKLTTQANHIKFLRVN